MNTLQYKEYQGAVTFEDGMLVIQILHIDDDITTTCDSASAAQAAFEELVDDYVETCAQFLFKDEAALGLVFEPSK